MVTLIAPLSDRLIRGQYPEYARTVQPPSISVPPDGWEEAMELTAPELRPAMEQWSALGLAVPEAGYELTGRAGRVTAEAELAWMARKIAVVLAEHPEWKASFEKADWRVFEGDAEKLGEAVAAALEA